MWKRKFNSAAGAEHQDVYTRVTNRIIADLEKGVRPWIRPWDVDNTQGPITRPLRHNGERYSGINVVLLWSSAMENGFHSPTWMTFRQASELDAHVRKGEKGSLVVYANTITKTEQGEDGEETERSIGFMKGYTVFNTEQIDGLPEQYRAPPPPKFTRVVERIEHCEQFFAATKADIQYVGHPACYLPKKDYIRMPPPEAFKDSKSLYATLAHEMVHWTSHPTRLARDFGYKSYGDPGYAKEELVAELGAAYLCVDLEVTPEVREDHAAYIGSWLQSLKEDRTFLFKAASFAQKAVDYLHELQPDATPALDEELETPTP